MRGKRIGFIISILAISQLLLIFVKPVFSGEDIFGKRARDIRFAIDSPFQISYLELVNLLSIASGEVVSQESIRKSVSSLNEKGIFERISVYGEVEDTQVDLVFLLEPSVSIGAITVDGVKYFSEKEVISKLRLRQGKLLTSVVADDIRRRLEGLYRKNGYFEAKVEIKVACSLEEGTSDVMIRVSEGRKPRLTLADIRGNVALSDSEIMDVLNVVVGQTLNLQKVNRRIEKLTKIYKKKGYLLVRINDPDISRVKDDTNLILVVEEGERFEIEFIGNERYSKGKLTSVSGIYTDTTNYEGGIVDAIKGKIGSFYVNKGFPFAKVDVAFNRETKKITVRVDERGKGLIRSIEFEGNTNTSGKELKKVMDTAERGFFSFLTGSGIYREEVLDSDLENLRGYYQSKGFPNASLTVGEIERPEEGKLNVKIHVLEGIRYTVRDIDLKGVAFFTTREIWSVLVNLPGIPIDYVSAYADSLKIQKLYFDKGFYDCKVAVSFITDEETSQIDVIYTVSEGGQFVLGKVLVSGNSKVSSNVILRELRTKRGEVFGEADLLRLQQRLYRTGLFRSVKTRKIKNYENKEINLLMEVEESDALVLEGGFGYGTDTGYRGSFGMAHKNINGLGRRVDGNLIVSEKENKFALDLTEPWLLGYNVDGGLNFTLQTTEEESFTLEKYSLGGSLTRKFWERSSISFQVEFTRDQTRNVAAGAIISPEDVRDDRVILLRPILVLDQRDDPFNPRRGTFNSLVGEFASGFIGSDIEYWKVTAQTAGYLRLKRNLILALSGRGGYAQSISGGEVPIDKRFLLGGRTTVRGFEEDRLGPIGTDGSPIGGDTMVNLNTELRYYLTRSIILALFFDGGSVWLRDRKEFDFDWRETAGYSIKYVTPVGPISFDMGFKLDRKENESKSEIHFTIGTAF